MSDPVNGVLVVSLLERAVLRLREEMYDLSATRFPGLRARHYRLLSFVGDEGARVSRIAAVSGLTKQALAQALRPLVDGGYVEVVQDLDDRRARVVRPTALGRSVNEAVAERMAEVEAGWAAVVGEGRYATARAVLGQVVALPSTGTRPPTPGARSR